MVSRREMICGASAVATIGIAGAFAGRYGFAAPAQHLASPAVPRLPASTIKLDFNIAERPTALPFLGGKTLPLLSFGDQEFPLIVRCKLGDRIVARVTNGLKNMADQVSIHWHGLRIPNGSDGVPFITQKPIEAGSTSQYDFTPPDTGTYFFHTHCNSVEHFGKGLVGVLIVEGDETTPYDADIVLAMKDWRISGEGNFLPFTTNEGAAKGGTFGTVRSVNGISRPTYDVGAGENIRLRILNVDPTRISEVGIEGAEAEVIAIDGNACPPFPLKSWRMGPAMRIDLGIKAPPAGMSAQLVDYYAPQPVVLSEFKSIPSSRAGVRNIGPLHAPHVASADLSGAERLTFAFSATATGQAISELPDTGIPLGALCLSQKSFWAINKRTWANMADMKSGPPLAELKLGRSYIFELINQTSRAHPVHIHGHTFAWLKSNLRTLPPHYGDTVLLLPKERIEVAFKADNPGNWMFHCHLLEHQETGMMGYIRVS